MIGAIVGDVVGSVHEFMGTKTTEFPLFPEGIRFTDDSVLSLAVADCLLTGASYVDKFHEYTNAYPDRPYGGSFMEWVEAGSRQPYNSWGNGSAMRVSPIGFAFDDVASVLEQAEASANVTHNHPEGIKGAQATALSILMARSGESKEAIRNEISVRFGYDLDRTVESIRPEYTFEMSCQKSVPEAIVSFLDSHDYESAIRFAISLGGDADTLACITGGIAGAYYGVPKDIAGPALQTLDSPLRAVLDEFCTRYDVAAV